MVFVTGGTGYLGRKFIPLLIRRGHQVTALARAGSERKVPSGCRIVTGDALNAASFVKLLRPEMTFVHMVGVAHPSPAKAQQFREIDLTAVRASVRAAKSVGVSHFVYVSVAHPAPVMRAYIETRMEAETLIRNSGLKATFLRPWYVLGPGHNWAHILRPMYWAFERIRSTRATALRLGLVTQEQMTAALAGAVEKPPAGIRIVEPPDIRKAALDSEDIVMLAQKTRIG